MRTQKQRRNQVSRLIIPAKNANLTPEKGIIMSALYQALPAVDKLLKTPQGEQFVAEFGHSATVNVCRDLLQQAREHINAMKIYRTFCKPMTRPFSTSANNYCYNNR